jgi:flagellar biosynthesis protein FlhG
LANFEFDQAEGLRRMLAGPKPQLLSVLSAASVTEKHALLLNLCASLARAGSSVLLVDACSTQSGVSIAVPGPQAPTLLQAARQQCASAQALRMLPQGFSFACLARVASTALLPEADKSRLATLFDALASQADITVVDADWAGEAGLLLPSMAAGDIVVQVSDNATSIKAAYSLIKRLNGCFGRRPVGVLVSGVTEARERVVFQNMAHASRRYLALELQSLGSVPQDEHLARAIKLNRSVIDAFPLAVASVAFRKLASRFARGAVLADGAFGMQAQSSRAGQVSGMPLGI